MPFWPPLRWRSVDFPSGMGPPVIPSFLPGPQPLRSSLLSDPKHLRFQACFRRCLRIPHGVMTNAYFSHLSSEHYNSWSLHIIRKIISNFNNDIFPRMKSLQISIRNEETFLIQSNLHRISKQNTSYKLGMPFFFPHRKPWGYTHNHTNKASYIPLITSQVHTPHTA